MAEKAVHGPRPGDQLLLVLGQLRDHPGRVSRCVQSLRDPLRPDRDHRIGREYASAYKRLMHRAIVVRGSPIDPNHMELDDPVSAQ